MTKLEILDEVVRWAREDSATKKDTLGADPASYREALSEEMSDEAFVQLVNRYLNTFHCPHHLAFYDPTDQRRFGFAVRYHENGLYVTKCLPETGFKVGDKVVALDGVDIDAFASQHPDYFASRTPERQLYDWLVYLADAAELTVERAGQQLSLTVGSVSDTAPAMASEPFVFKSLTPDTVYLKMENFADEKALSDLYAKSSSAIANSKNLIIDVRVNHGGSDSLYYPLLPYLLPVGQTLVQATAHVNEQQEMLYTARNVDCRLQELETELANPELSADSRTFYELFRADLLANREEGYVLCELTSELEGQPVGLADAPERVVVLSDVTCGSSGDTFVWNMTYLPKVTVMGRSTMGIMDYANCFNVSFGKFQMIVPSSRYLGIDDGRALTDRGIAPDIWIDWTPEHLVRDVDLEAALALLAQ